MRLPLFVPVVSLLYQANVKVYNQSKPAFALVFKFGNQKES